jgi:hypothetical protein
VAEDIKKHPELRLSKDWFDMDRAEQMKAWWEVLGKYYKHDPERYFYSVKSEPYYATGLLPGLSPLTLHFGMFISSIERLGSD